MAGRGIGSRVATPPEDCRFGAQSPPLVLGRAWRKLGDGVPSRRRSMSRGKERGEAESRPGTPAPAGARPSSAAPLTSPSGDAEVGAFVQRMRALSPQAGAGRGRLVFAMDATMSRQPTWDMALALQAEMFRAVKAVGGLDVQLVYFRGAGECRASKWVFDAEALAQLMARVACAGGYTQIGKVLSHVKREAGKQPVGAL